MSTAAIPGAGHLPDALGAANDVRPVVFALSYSDGSLRLALTPDEAAPLLGLSPKVVRELCRTEQIHARVVHPGSSNARYLISVNALIEFLGGARSDDPSSTG
jgi:hypothetical protein